MLMPTWLPMPQVLCQRPFVSSDGTDTLYLLGIVRADEMQRPLQTLCGYCMASIASNQVMWLGGRPGGIDHTRFASWSTNKNIRLTRAACVAACCGRLLMVQQSNWCCFTTGIYTLSARLWGVLLGLGLAFSNSGCSRKGPCPRPIGHFGGSIACKTMWPPCSTAGLSLFVAKRGLGMPSPIFRSIAV